MFLSLEWGTAPHASPGTAKRQTQRVGVSGTPCGPVRFGLIRACTPLSPGEINNDGSISRGGLLPPGVS